MLTTIKVFNSKYCAVVGCFCPIGKTLLWNLNRHCSNIKIHGESEWIICSWKVTYGNGGDNKKYNELILKSKRESEKHYKLFYCCVRFFALRLCSCWVFYLFSVLLKYLHLHWWTVCWETLLNVPSSSQHLGIWAPAWFAKTCPDPVPTVQTMSTLESMIFPLAPPSGQTLVWAGIPVEIDLKHQHIICWWWLISSSITKNKMYLLCFLLFVLPEHVITYWCILEM